MIIAEGALSESFIDDDSRGMFHNAHEYAMLYPEPRRRRRNIAHRVSTTVTRSRRRRRASRGAPGCGRQKAAERRHLRGYVDVISPRRIAGWAQNVDHPEAPVCLDIYAGDR